MNFTMIAVGGVNKGRETEDPLMTITGKINLKLSHQKSITELLETPDDHKKMTLMIMSTKGGRIAAGIDRNQGDMEMTGEKMKNVVLMIDEGHTAMSENQLKIARDR